MQDFWFEGWGQCDLVGEGFTATTIVRSFSQMKINFIIGHRLSDMNHSCLMHIAIEGSNQLITLNKYCKLSNEVTVTLVIIIVVPLVYGGGGTMLLEGIPPSPLSMM